MAPPSLYVVGLRVARKLRGSRRQRSDVVGGRLRGSTGCPRHRSISPVFVRPGFYADPACNDKVPLVAEMLAAMRGPARSPFCCLLRRPEVAGNRQAIVGRCEV